MTQLQFKGWKRVYLYFSVRNAGNIIPHSQHFLDEFTTNEPAALELGCVVNDIRHIIVCGHSDCKAINLLYKLQDSEFASQVCTLSYQVILNSYMKGYQFMYVFLRCVI